MNKKRLLYLDNLKVCLMVLVIFHHAGQAYGDGGGWAYHPSNPAEFMPWIWHFFSVNAAFFMGLFFLISGYFVPVSFDKQGAKVFVQKKLMRLGIPLLLMGGLLSVLSGKPEIGHMWYIESLLVFCLIYALVRQFCNPINGKCSSAPTIIGLLIFGGTMGIGSYLIRQVSPQDHWIWPFGIIPLPMEPAHYLQYVMMFVIGIMARQFAWLMITRERLSKTFSEGAAQEIYQEVRANGDFLGFARQYSFDPDYRVARSALWGLTKATDGELSELQVLLNEIR